MVEQLRTGETLNADRFVNAQYERLRGHALDPYRLKFENAGLLRSTLVVANADPGVKWHSFGALVAVTCPPTPSTKVFRRVDFYSVAPRDSDNDLYLGDAYLRLDVAANGAVLDAEFGSFAHETPTRNAYGTMLHVAALALGAADVEVLV